GSTAVRVVFVGQRNERVIGGINGVATCAVLPAAVATGVLAAGGNGCDYTGGNVILTMSFAKPVAPPTFTSSVGTAVTLSSTTGVLAGDVLLFARARSGTS